MLGQYNEQRILTDFLRQVAIISLFTYFYILSQRANAKVDCFENSVRLVHVFTKQFSKENNAELCKDRLEHHFNRQSLELEETTNIIEVGCR